MSLKSQIQDLISAARTEDAVKILAQHSQDGVLLQARFANGKRQYLNGLLDSGEWFRIQNQINFAALELSESIPGLDGNGGGGGNSGSPGNGGGHVSQPTVQPQPKVEDKKPKVFISYNHGDHADMRVIKSELERAGIDVIVDIQNMLISGKIQDFINSALKNSEFVLSIVSEKSLSSGWVGKETGAVLLLNQLDETKWIPVDIDKACFDNKFFNKKLKDFDEKIAELKAQASEAFGSDGDPTPILEEKKRLDELKVNFGNIISTLRNRLVVNLSSNEVFDSGIQRIVNHIKSASA